MSAIQQRIARLLCLFTVVASVTHGQETAPSNAAPSDAAPSDAKRSSKRSDQFDEFITQTRKSVVVVTAADRRGEPLRLGSGFLLGDDGVVVTNLHVIGRGRKFRLQLADDRFLTPVAVLAYDRRRDLALIEIEETDLPSLTLSDSDDAEPGDPVASVGHPLGFRMSVSRGVVSGKREIDGLPMIQVAMPIEVGNSGGPLIDENGEVIGVIARKSGDGLGFAVRASDVRVLVEHPHPTTIDRWVTIGALDPKRWRPLMGGEWRQRAGTLIASGSGRGFGGRMLCLRYEPPPVGRFEIAVEVKLEDERGAAGLAFHSDGADRHYGFYPTNGKLRLTRFNGPDVFSWTILRQISSEHYRMLDWNEIRLSVDGAKLSCFLNNHKVIELEDDGLARGKVGLVKFRQPGAEFRRFRVGSNLSSTSVDPERREKVLELTGELSPRSEPDAGIIDTLSEFSREGRQVLLERSKQLENEAARLRLIGDLIHQRAVQRELEPLFAGEDTDVDLLKAALLIAKSDNSDLDVQAYLDLMDRMASEVSELTAVEDSETAKLEILSDYMFRQLGFHGSRFEYYHRSNSYINEVLEDREGLPITLSVIFIELARRVGLTVEGLGIPRHFIVRFVPKEGEGVLIDVFADGEIITLERAKQLSDGLLEESHLVRASNRSIIVRMLRNLSGVASRENDLYGVLHYTDLIVALEPSSAYERRMRAQLRYQTAQPKAAQEDLRWLLENAADEIDVREVERLLRQLEKATDSSDLPSSN